MNVALHDREVPSVLVIGGGIAGSVCALRLAQRGAGVDLVEKQSFPRAKACGCCLGGTGLAVLEQLSMRDAVLRRGTPTNRWFASLDSRCIDLELPPGVAISREVLDPLLLDAAGSAGANVFMRCSATVRTADSEGVTVELKLDSGTHQRRYDIVVVASGLSAIGVNSILPWTEVPHGPFGVSCTIKSESIQPGTIYMACQEDGYVGMVRLDDERVDVAAALRSGSDWARFGTPLDRMKRLLAQSAFDPVEFDDVSEVMTTPPLRRTRKFGNGRVIAVGDAAGYVEPFTGEGMTWAMQSGIAAADLIASTGNHLAIGEQWQRELGQLLRSKKRVCRIVTGALRSNAIRGSVARVLSTFPGLANPLLRSLNHPVA